MNKKNLADLVIRQSEFKGEMGVARADITPPPNIYARSWGSAQHGCGSQGRSARFFATRWSGKSFAICYAGIEIRVIKT